MNYTIYEINENPSFEQRDLAWSVLLFGDNVQIVSPISVLLVLHAEFPYMPEKNKWQMYADFGPSLAPSFDWAPLEKMRKDVLHIRHKRFKNKHDMQTLANIQTKMKPVEKAFSNLIKDVLALFSFQEFTTLIQQTDEEKLPDVEVKIAIRGLEKMFDSDLEENFILIITKALAEKDNLLVLDQRIEPFITNYRVSEYNDLPLREEEKIPVYSEKLFVMPLCYSLNANEILLVRNELKYHFKEFHSILHCISKGEENLESGMNKIRSLLPALQNKIESNIFVQNVRNKQQEVLSVDIHLAFTSNRSTLTLLKHLGMMDEENVLQAGEILVKESNIDQVRPFIFIKHRKKE